MNFNVLNRRAFLDRSARISLGVALSALVDVPLVMKRALAQTGIDPQGLIGRKRANGRVKKLLFIFLRGANDGLNSVIPILDNAYVDLATGQSTIRPEIVIPPEPGLAYDAQGGCDFAASGPTNPTFDPDNDGRQYAIRLGNGFAALHPSLKFLAPVYNAGQLALVHRVGYPKQSRSHFDSQAYWETGNPGNKLVRDGILYRTMLESRLGILNPDTGKPNSLTAVSIQSSLPLILRGSEAAMTNLTDPTRFQLLSPTANVIGNPKLEAALATANGFPFPDRKNRDLLSLQYQNLTKTLDIFGDLLPALSETGNTFRDMEKTDGDENYYLFPTTNSKNGGYAFHNSDAGKYVVDTGAYDFFERLKAAAIILNKTDAVIAGTEIGGFDTHSDQGGITGSHANLQRRIGWAIYALRKYFQQHGEMAAWDDLVVVTLSEFGRTTVQNSDAGTDHAEAGLMFVAGGGVKGYDQAAGRSGVYGCHPGDSFNGSSVPWQTGQTGSMFQVSSRYLKRAVDYRSVLGELVRDHLGATDEQLKRIVPGYANESREHLRGGGTSDIDPAKPTQISGELGLV